jgi:prephenate dehydrogenase
MTIGLIGYGRFGKFLAHHLAKSATVYVYDRRPAAIRLGKGRIHRAALPLVASREVVILALPVSSLRPALKAIRPHLRAGTLVLDVCAAKVTPARWMRELIPPRVRILGTHPLFGPSSARESLEGKRIVLCPVRIPRRMLATVRRVLRRKGLVPLVMTEEAHDLLVAETVFLTQYTGRLLLSFPLGVWDHVTPNYAALRRMMETAAGDSWETFADMVRHNSHTLPVLRALGEGHTLLERRLRTPGVKRGEG